MRLDGIDILRGTAVSAVVVYHFYMLLGLTHSESFIYAKHFGSLGVPLFFVISGYLIFRSVERSITQRGLKEGILNYTFHRLFRILPAYYFNLFVVLLIAAFFIANTYYYSSDFFRQFFSHLTFTSYFLYKSAGFGVNGAYWTLGIEMFWYIVAPLLFLFARSTQKLLLLGITSLLYIWLLSQGKFDTFLELNPATPNYRLMLYYYYTQLWGQINFFLAGIFIYKYRLTLDFLSPWFALALLCTFVGVMGYFNLSFDFLPAHLLQLATVSFLFMLLYTTHIKWGGLLAWIGKISYSLYLWHMPILYVMQRSNILQHRSIYETVLFFLVILFALSSMSYYFIEEGGFMLRKKLIQHILDAKQSPGENI